MNPAVNQVWALLVPVMGGTLVRVEHRIEEIHGPVVVLRSIENGKLRTVSRSVLACGRRGAILVRAANGEPVARPAKRGPPKSHPQARRAAELLAEGVDVHMTTNDDDFDEAVKVREALKRFCDRYAYQTRHGTDMGADLVLDEMVLFVREVRPR